MVYIQSNSERTLPHHFDAACALYGTIESARDYRLTSFEEVQSGKFDNFIKTNLFVGSVEFMREVFNRVDRTPEPILNSDRDPFVTTLLEVRKTIEAGRNVFVKPIQQKLFSGLLVDKYSISCLRDFPDDLLVNTYEPIENIVSEWRVYILRDRMMDSKNYSGDFKIPIDYSYVEKKIKELKDKLPIAYVMDVGVDKNGEHYIIEFNDMYAIGNYGIDNTVYVNMLRDRYFEIIRNQNPFYS